MFGVNHFLLMYQLVPFENETIARNITEIEPKIPYVLEMLELKGIVKK